MSGALTDPFVLPADLLVVERASLPPALRDAVGPDEVALTRPRGRSTSGVVERAVADLLEGFRQPRTIVEAVLDYARERALDPETTLQDTYPVLRRCIQERFLVLAGTDAAASIEPLLSVGDRVDDVVVTGCLQVLEDIELHRAEQADGTLVALKTTRGPAARAAETLAREAALLAYLDGEPTPRLLGQGTVDDRSYLLLEWCEGLPVTAAAGLLPTADRVGLAAALVGTYLSLHVRGAVHGDVHPGNTMVGADGRVRLLDLGLARRVDGGEPAVAPRGGILAYLEPEYATAMRAGRRPPQVTAAAERYSVAALAYEVLTGRPRLEWAVDEAEQLRQVAEDPPRPFADAGTLADVGVSSSPSVEHALRALLVPDPGARPDLGELAAALAAVTTAGGPGPGTASAPAAPRAHGAPAAPAATDARDRRQVARSPGLERLLARTVQRLGPDAAALSEPLTAPTASVTYGAAGIAYALLRIAGLRERADLLVAADLWCARAAVEAAAPAGLTSTDLAIDASLTGTTTPYHRASGVHLVQALVGLAMGDVVSTQAAVHGFVSESTPAALPTPAALSTPAALTTPAELTLGRSGTVLAAAMLLEALGGHPYVDVEEVRVLGDAAVERVWTDVSVLPPVAEGGLAYPGLAHGWAGIALAALRWHTATGHPLPAALPRRLDELAGVALEHGRGLRWPWVLDGRPVRTMTGWCNGSAGYVHLWTTAHAVLGDERWLGLAERAALAVLDAPSDSGMLCCGAGGQAYALLALHRATGEQRWLLGADQLGQRAAARVGVAGGSTDLRDSLFKGELGVALLAADLAAPAASAMPFVDPEGWPAAAARV